MRNVSLLDEVKAVNFAFLSLVRGMAKNKETGHLEKLGFNSDMVDRFANLSDGQLEKLALSGQLLCRFQMRTANLLGALAAAPAVGASMAAAVQHVKETATESAAVTA